MSYWNNGTGSNNFGNKGPAGKYYAVQTVNNATVDFTGSNHGYGALVVGESSPTGTVTLSGGGSINLAHLTQGVVYEFDVRKVTVNAKAIYVMKVTPQK